MITGQIQRMRGSRAHPDAWPHHSYRRQRYDVSIDAAADGDQVLGFGGNQAPQRHIVHMVVTEYFPSRLIRCIVDLNRPCAADDGVREFPAGTHIVCSKGVSANDPSGLPYTG